MSKKIIAIALFATMVLSMFAVSANAAWVDTAPQEGIQIYVYNKSGTNAAGDVPSGAIADTNEKDVSGMPKADTALAVAATESGKTTTLKGDYKKFSSLTKEYYADPLVVYIVEFVLQGFDSTVETDTDMDFTFTGKSGSVKPEKFEDGPNKDKYGFRYEFTFEKGGNKQEVALGFKSKLGTKPDLTMKHTIVFTDTTGADKPTRALVLYPEATPKTAGDYTSRTIKSADGSAFALEINVAIDLFGRVFPYNDTVSSTDVVYPIIPLGFKFKDEDGVAIPAKGFTAYVVDDNDLISNASPAKSDKFFAIGQVGTSFDKIAANAIKYDTTFKIPVNAGFTGNTFKIAIQDSKYVYESGNINVVINKLPRNVITNVVIAQGRNITIKTGETVELTIAPAFFTTYKNVTLVARKAQSNVFINGMKLLGLEVGGPVEIDVYAKEGGYDKVIDTVLVTVVGEGGVVSGSSYRVVVKGSLNVRTGPGTSYGIVGKLSPNAVVNVISIENGWAKIADNQYVSAAYLVAVNNVTGNAITTASSLNVRSGPGTGYGITGKLSYGSSINISGYSADGKWANIGNGWVSVQYVK